VPEAPSYAIVGRGRWANRIHTILAGEGRRSVFVEGTRRKASESESDFKTRLTARITESASQIAWLCTSPGPHVSLMAEAAITAGLHVIVEKPWLLPHSETEPLARLATSKHVLAGVHYQYCLLDRVEKWRTQLDQGAGLIFHGHFCVDRPDHLRVPAIDNLGCHLFAIREYAVPKSVPGEIRCAYEQPDARRVWTANDGKTIASIDFLGSDEPIIQRYIAAFEAALGGASFPFDLDFGASTAEALAWWKQRKDASRNR
jgi:predicted dehydrogenase